MAVLYIRNSADDGWIPVGVTWADSIRDADGDTKVQCEESADEDIIRMDCAGTEVWKMSAAGERTMALQPAFHVLSAGDQNNVASDATIVFDTEVKDQGNDFAANTFTAPVDGMYHFSGYVYAKDVDADYNYARVMLVTSNDNFSCYMLDPAAESWGADSTYMVFCIGITAWMDASDTAHLIWQHSGGADQVDLAAGGTFFSGFLAC